MDVHGSHSLVLAADSAPQEIVVFGVPLDDEPEADFVDLLQQAIVLLCQFIMGLLSALRVLEQRLADLTRQANYYCAQHRRACEREDKLKELLQLREADNR